jgi:hypothetical protein
MSQQQVARSIWLTVAMMAMSTLMLIAAVLSLIAHAPGVGEGFLAVMIVFGAASFASSFASRNRARTFVQEGQREQQASLDSSFRNQGRSDRR